MSVRAVGSGWTMGKAKHCFFVMLIITLLTLWLPASEVLAIKVWVASWLPMAATLDAADASAYSDKLVHASLFALLGWLAVRGWVLAQQRWRPVARLPVARQLGDTSLMFLVHPTLTEADLARTLWAIAQLQELATRS